MKKYEMIGSSEEDRKMQEGLKRNQIKMRKVFEANSKRERLENFYVKLITVGLGIAVGVGTVALMILISIIENI